jgi:23S rRNA (guanine2445-N2)-methyltransferase / 23S rRNA (guanine2069-N7)-methyltransferase
MTMISACAITDKGIEKITLLELDEIIKAKGKAEEYVALFECKSPDEAFTFCYKAQSIKRVLLLWGAFDFKDQDDLVSKAKESLKSINLGDWFEKDKTFKVECERIGKHSFGSQSIEEDVGEKIIFAAQEKLGFMPSASMKSPDTIIYVFINKNKAYFGVDLAGRDLSKRNYRIFSAPGIINSNLAYALVRMSGYSKAQRKKIKFLDVFCRSGVICIEAALYATGLSVNYYSNDFAFRKLKPFAKKDWEAFFKKVSNAGTAGTAGKSKDSLEKLDITGSDQMLRNVEASKKNAKLAGVDKLISFSRIDVDWVDTKFDKNAVDLVVSRIPCPSKHTPEQKAKKIYKEMLYQLEFVMKKGGKLAFLTENTTLFKEMLTQDFKLISEDELWAGEQRYQFVMVEKN